MRTLRLECVWVKMIRCRWEKRHLKVSRVVSKGERDEFKVRELRRKFAFMSAVGSWRYLKQRLIWKSVIFSGGFKKVLITASDLKATYFLLVIPSMLHPIVMLPEHTARIPEWCVKNSISTCPAWCLTCWISSVLFFHFSHQLSLIQGLAKFSSHWRDFAMLFRVHTPKYHD